MLIENCPECGKELKILEDELEVQYEGSGTIRVDAKAYCDDCDETYYGSYYMDAARDQILWA